MDEDFRPFAPEENGQEPKGGTGASSQNFDTQQWVYYDYGPVGGPHQQKPKKPKKEKKPGRGTRVLAIVMSALFVLTAGAFAAYVVFFPTVQTQTERSTVEGDLFDEESTPDGDTAAGVEGEVLTNRQIYKKVEPAIVGIICYERSVIGMQEASQGSGIVFRSDGYIVTNCHVVRSDDSTEPYSRIEVVLTTGDSYTAQYIGGDRESDLAVLKIDAEGLTTAVFGDSEKMQVGDWVMSVGSPFGLENSVSQGIVSALSRNTLLENSSGNTLYTNLIQTDATINPGNSGGALVNDRGQLVGICTLYSSDTQSFAGIGYAIPSDYAVEIADKIIAGETVTHAYIGLSMQTVTPSAALSNGLSVDEGAYVVEVFDGSPAAEAGIQVGDVVTSIGGEAVSSADGAILAVRSHDIGDTVEVKVMRGEKELSFDVTLGSDEALQQEQDDEQTVNVNGQEISLEDLIELYQQYQQQRNNPFGGR